MLRLPIALVATLVAATVAAAAPVPKGDAGGYFPTEVGTTWVYEDSQGQGGRRTRKVTAVAEKDGGKVVTVQSGGEDGELRPFLTFRVAPDGLYLVSIDFLDPKPFDTPDCLLKLPHKDGGSWEVPLDGGGVTTTATARGPEDVTVPAGTFRAIRVETEFTNRSGVTRKHATWYAPGVGEVQSESSAFPTTDKSVGPGYERTVLKSFTRGKG